MLATAEVSLWTASGQFPVLSVLEGKLKRMVFTSLRGDPCVHSGEKGDIRISVCTHVDELVVCAKKKAREASTRQFKSQDSEFSTRTGRSSRI